MSYTVFRHKKVQKGRQHRFRRLCAKDKLIKKSTLHINRLYSSVVELSLRTQEVTGSISARG